MVAGSGVAPALYGNSADGLTPPPDNSNLVFHQGAAACGRQILTSAEQTATRSTLRLSQRFPTLSIIKDLLVLLAHLLTTLAKLLGPSGTRAMIADNLLTKQQLLIISRPTNLSTVDKILLGFWSLFLSTHRVQQAAVVVRPSTLLRFHEAPKKSANIAFSFHSLRNASPGLKVHLRNSSGSSSNSSAAIPDSDVHESH